MIVISLSFFEETPPLSYCMLPGPLAVETKPLIITNIKIKYTSAAVCEARAVAT